MYVVVSGKYAAIKAIKGEQNFLALIRDVTISSVGSFLPPPSAHL